MVPIGRALRPIFDLFICLKVMPGLLACVVQEPPSLDVCCFWFTDRGYRRAVEVLLGAIDVAIRDRLLLPRHLGWAMA